MYSRWVGRFLFFLQQQTNSYYNPHECPGVYQVLIQLLLIQDYVYRTSQKKNWGGGRCVAGEVALSG
jgi:hypothetical protein